MITVLKLNINLYGWTPCNFVSRRFKKICSQFISDSRSYRFCRTDSFCQHMRIRHFQCSHDSSSPFLCSLSTTCYNIDSFAAGKNNTRQLFLSSKLNFVVNWLASWPCRLLTSTRASKIDGFQQPSWCTEAFRLIFCYWRNTKFLCSTLLSRLRRWWVGRPANTRLEDNVCRSKEPMRQRVHKMWIQFRGGLMIMEAESQSS